MKRAAVAISVAGFAIVACQVVAGIERVEKDQRGVGAEAGAVDGGGDSAATDPCQHAAPNPLPDNDDDREGTIPPFYLAVRTLSLTGQDGNGFVGFDLDNVCTCDKRPGTFQKGASSCTPKGNDCDSDGGVDNQGAALFATFAGGTGVSVDKSANDDIANGQRNLLLNISEWNGKPNDREVYVGIMVSNGIVDPSGCGFDSGKEFHPPQWCGHDKWTYPPDGTLVVKGEVFPILRGKGYVSNNQLVFRSESSITIFFGGTATISFGSPITAGRLEKTAQGYKLSGLIAGRMPVTELLGAVGQFNVGGNDAGGKEYLCNSPIFPTVKKTLCDSVDINRTNAFDFKEGACNAISAAITFTAEPAEIGVAKAFQEDPAACEPVGADPRYTCP